MNTLPYPKIGDRVLVVQKKDYESGVLTEGIVAQILTKVHDHPRGTKVCLTSGIIGRVQVFPDLSVDRSETKNPSHETSGPVVIYEDDPEALT